MFIHCTFYYPVFNARCRIRVHCSLPQLCPQLKQVFVSSTFRSLSQKRAFSQGSEALPDSSSESPLVHAETASRMGGWNGMGGESLPDQKKKNPINEKPGGGQPPSWAMAALGPGLQGSTASSTGPSCGSNPLLPAPLTKKTLLLFQCRQLSQTSEVRWYK